MAISDRSRLLQSAPDRLYIEGFQEILRLSSEGWCFHFPSLGDSGESERFERIRCPHQAFRRPTKYVTLSLQAISEVDICLNVLRDVNATSD